MPPAPVCSVLVMHNGFLWFHDTWACWLQDANLKLRKELQQAHNEHSVEKIRQLDLQQQMANHKGIITSLKSELAYVHNQATLAGLR